MSSTFIHFNQKQKYPLATKIVLRAAKELGFKAEIIDKKTGFLTKITHKGKSRFFSLGDIPKFPLNTALASALAKDKAFSYLIFKEAGIKVPLGNYFFEEEKKNAMVFAEKMGYPVFVKPNSKEGGLLCQRVYSKKELARKIREIFKIDRAVMIQKPVEGREYRILILDNKTLLAYEKTPPFVVGDGKSSIGKLISKKNRELKKTARKEIRVNDAVREKLKNLKMDLRRVLPPGKKIFLRDSANLFSGGQIIGEIDNLKGEKIKEIIKKISQIFDIRFFALDLIAKNIKNPKEWVILEINSDPAFSGYYQYNPQKTIEIYKKIIRACLRRP